ncbi:hypothetical protein BDC45DRAFT_607649 [Circinella umbellata]|nr:hypothetical protein BDC45DRAFT_607649 [Circinella umbellata]
MMNNTYNDTMTATNAPLAGWLAKLKTLPLGRSRWRYFYFVLLDSELRFYKDEHAYSASRILDLKNVSKITQLALPNHSFCIRLEPSSTQKSKPWTLACSSQADLEAWTCALQKRLVRLSTNISSPKPPLMENLNKKRPTNSWFSQPSSSSFYFDDTDNDSICSFNKDIDNDNDIIQQQSDNYYHAVTSSTVVRPRIRKNKNQPPPSLSRRRGIYMKPLIIASSPFNRVSKNRDDTDYYVHALSPFTSTPTSCSDVSLTSSLSFLSLATTAVDTESFVDDSKAVMASPPLSSSITKSYENEETLDRRRSMSTSDIFENNINKHVLTDGETSPTFLLYKKQFHLC